MISENELRQVVRNVKHKYNAMQRNGFVVPAQTSTIVNNAYLDKVSNFALYAFSYLTFHPQVREGVIWTPRTFYSKQFPNSEAVVYKICPNAPSKTVLEGILCTLAKQRNKNLGIDANHKPDRNWIILAIATLEPDHEIFGKSYKPEVRQEFGQAPGVMVNNADGFYTGLPALSSVKDLKVKTISCLSKEERIASQLAKEQAKIQKANQRIEHLASKVEEVKEGGRRADRRFDIMQENEHLR